MNDIIYFLGAPLVMCFLLVGIHCYLGLHVIARGVIFVDLALAQVAALGSVIVYASFHEHSKFEVYAISLIVTLVAAAYLSLINRLKHRISQEAMIGIIYAFASAAVILVVDKLSHGAEHIKNSLVGQILWVTWDDVIRVFIIYSVVGLLHFVFKKQFIRSSFVQEGGALKWDFLFYALFGVVITCSVQVSGVLLVFAFLIVPSVIGFLFFKRIRERLIFGWLMGFFLTTLGMLLSYYFDLPAGALIVAIYAATPILILLFGYHKFKKVV